MDKNKPKPNQGSTWNDENEKLTNPNRRQEEDQDSNVESPRGDQRASESDLGSTESPPSDRSESERLHGDRQRDTSRSQDTLE